MSRRIKPVSVLEFEKKSHRSKAELQFRLDGEKANLSGKGMSEFDCVKDDPVAHKEFLRIKRMLGLVEKNDALYETVINRYCEVIAEVYYLKEQRQFNTRAMKDIRDSFDELMDELEPMEKIAAIEKITKLLVQYQNSNNRIDQIMSSKRHMLFAIEKENIFTIASALRSIPKKPEKEEDELIKALKGG